MSETYGIYSEGGQEITQLSTTYDEARRVAVTCANRMREAVYLDTVPSSTDPTDDDDVGETIYPASEAQS